MVTRDELSLVTPNVMAATVPHDVSKALAVGGPPPAGLSPDEKHAWALFDSLYDADPNSKDVQDILSMFNKLDESRPQ